MLLLTQAIGARQPQRSGRGRQLYANQVDTLTLGERFSLKTSALDWALLLPNLGVEFTLGNRNWSRWTLGVYGRLKPSTHTLQTSYHVYDLTDVRLELRRYRHGKGLLRSWFAGAYGAVGTHNLKWNATGYEGSHMAVGLTAGTLAPLYSFRGGSSLDLELSVSAGVLLARHDEYEKSGEAYVVTKPRESYRLTWDALPYLLAHDVVKVSFVWHFGPSVANRYKPRVAIDEQYRLHLNEMAIRRDSTREARRQYKEARRDSLDKADYERRFEKQRLELDRKYVNDSIKALNTGY
jgi:hypothetical protein